MPLRLATRGSALARAQAALAAAALTGAGHAGCETVIIRTEGDRRPDAPVEALSGQGWFTAELERAVLDGRADLAVHSAKDLPVVLAPGLAIAAHLARGDARDGVVTAGECRLDGLPAGATVATSSVRRTALLGVLYPHLRVVPVRGNVDTRLAKLDAGAFDALVVACAGLDRLGLAARFAERLDPTVFVPAPAQGTIALEAVTGSGAGSAAIAADDPGAAVTFTAERSVLMALGGSCLLPLGAWARLAGDDLVMTAALAVDGEIRRTELGGPRGDPAGLGARVAAMLR